MITIIFLFLLLHLQRLIHELGHFFVAKRAGVAIEEFGIGYRPRLCRLWQGQGSIMLDSQEFLIDHEVVVLRDIKVGSRVLAKTSSGSGGKKKVMALGLAPEGIALPDEEDKHSIFTVEALTRPTEYTLNWLLFGSFVKMSGQRNADVPASFASKSKRTRFAILAVGPLLSLMTAVTFLIPAIVFLTLANVSGVPELVMGINTKGEEVPVAKAVISSVVPDTPAASAGLQPGDVVIGADEIELRYQGDLLNYVEETKGTEITLHFDRGEEILTTSLTPRVNPPEGQGAMGVTITYDHEQHRVYYPLPKALVKGVSDTIRILGLIVYTPIGVLTHTIPAEVARPMSRVEVSQQAGSAVISAMSENWWSPFFSLLAIFSVGQVYPIILLTVVTLLPLPGWDSWRILSLIFLRQGAVRNR